MCRFASPVEHVANTRILARSMGDRQVLVYSMAVDSPTGNAMIIPLPTPAGVGEDAIEWIDLSEAPSFFDSLELYYAMDSASGGGSRSRGAVAAEPTLAVHEVGDFEASFVPGMADFDRLDERFRLAPGLRTSLARYTD